MSVFREYLWQWKSFNRNIRAFLLFELCNQFAVTVYSLYFPRYLLAVGHQEDLLGSLMGTATIFTALLAVLAGILSDRFGRRNSLILGVAVSRTAFLLRGFVISVPLLFGVFAVEGAFITLYSASTTPFIFENCSPRNRVHAYSLNGMVWRLAGISGNILGGLLPLLVLKLDPKLGDVSVYRIIFVFSALISVLGLLQLLRIESPRQKAKVPGHYGAGLLQTFSQISRQELGFLTRFVTMRCLIGFGAALFLPFMNTFLIREFAASPDTVGLIFSLAQFATIIAIALAPKLAEKWGLTSSLLRTRVLALPLFFIFAFVPNIWLVALAYILRNSLQQMSGPLENNFLMSGLSKQTRATANGILNSANSAVRAAAMFLAGIIITRYGYRYIFLLALISYTLSALMFYLFFVSKAGAEYARLIQEKAAE